jgi:ubiquinone/menaquinone biosynthesis C-methylase UbiE
MPEGVVSVGLPEWNADTMPLPYGNHTVGEVWALHFLEHVQKPIAVLAEIQRVLCIGGVANIVVPYGTCHMAVQDLSHTHFFNESSWDHAFRNPYYNDHDLETGWHLTQHINCIMGVKGENLALVTQLVRT